VLATQDQRLGLTFVIGGDFITRHQIDRGLAAFFRRQAVARATKEHAGGCRTNLHRAAARLTRDIGHNRLVGTHAALRALSYFEFLLEVAVELVEYIFPVALTLGHVIEVLFHAGGKAVIHQVGEALGQTLCNDVAHLFRIEPTVVQRYITTVLDGGDDRRVGRWTTDTALFHFLDQAGFRVTRRRLGEVLGRVELDQLQRIALGHVRQYIVVTRLGDLRHHAGVAIELEDTTLGT